MPLINRLYGGVQPLSSLIPEAHSFPAHTMPNIFGGVDTFGPTGNLIATTRQNIFGGEDILGQNGGLLASTRPNIFGGEDILGANHSVIGSSHQNIYGGQDIFGADNGMLGFTRPNIFGGSDLMGDGGLLASSQPSILGGFNISSNDFAPPSFDTISSHFGMGQSAWSGPHGIDNHSLGGFSSPLADFNSFDVGDFGANAFDLGGFDGLDFLDLL